MVVVEQAAVDWRPAALASDRVHHRGVRREELVGGLPRAAATKVCELMPTGGGASPARAADSRNRSTKGVNRLAAADDRERHGRPREPARSHALGCARREQQLELLGEQLVVVVESPS
jgi:hypothetical protein